MIFILLSEILKGKLKMANELIILQPMSKEWCNIQKKLELKSKGTDISKSIIHLIFRLF